MLLAYDQGLEHGPTDFNDETIDPGYILDIADQGAFTGIILQKGLAAAYYQADKITVPLIIKMNGRTSLSTGRNLYAPMTCTVAEAADLGAKAVGYTLYLGSTHESRMVAELSDVVRDAHEKRLPVIAWMNTSCVRVDEAHRDILAYAGRIALELGADYAPLPFAGSVPDYAWVVESAGKCKVLAPGGPYKEATDTTKLARSVLQAGGKGLIVGRRIWQAPDPLEVARQLRAAVWPDGGRPHAKV